MSNDEITQIKHLADHCRKLSAGKAADGNFDVYRSLRFAADAIESLQAQLTESQRRERAAAVESGVNPDGTIRYVCPNAQCGHLFWDRQYVTAYCPDCGQALSSDVPIYDDDRGPGAGEGDSNA